MCRSCGIPLIMVVDIETKGLDVLYQRCLIRNHGLCDSLSLVIVGRWRLYGFAAFEDLHKAIPFL